MLRALLIPIGLVAFTASFILPAHALAACPSFARSLSVGSQGTDVLALQKFLNAQGFPVAGSGAGSPGNETTYFGPATKRAVISFQEWYTDDILTPAGLAQGTGYFGPGSIRKARSILGCTATTPSNTTQISATTPATTATSCPTGFTCTPSTSSTDTSSDYTSNTSTSNVSATDSFIDKPAFYSLSPSTGNAGSQIYIQGEAFSSGITSVMFTNGSKTRYIAPSLVSGGGATLAVRVPQDLPAGIWQVRIRNKSGSTSVLSSGSGGFTIREVETVAALPDPEPTDTTTPVPAIPGSTATTTTPTPVIPAATTTQSGLCTLSSPQVSVYILMGQSNAVGIGKSSEASSDANSIFGSVWPFKIWINDASSWAPGSTLLTSQLGYFGPELYLASGLYQGGENDFYIFKYAVGATTLAGNWKARGGGGLYDKAIASYQKARSAICKTGKLPVIKGMFWMQGESDAADPTMTQNYATNLRTLISQVRTDLISGKVPFIIGLINSKSGVWAYANQLRGQQASAAKNSTNVYTIETNDLPIYPSACTASPECNAHYNTQGQKGLGIRFYEKYIEATGH